MGMNKCDLHDSLLKRRTVGKFDDFLDYTSPGFWTSTLNGSATAAIKASGVGGILTMSAIDSVANRELYVASTNSFFLLQNLTPIIVEADIQFTEANTNNACVMFGLMNSVGNGSIVNTTGAPTSSFSGAVIYKVPGATVWQTASSVSSTQIFNTSTTASGIATYSRLRIEIEPVSSTLAEVTYWVDGIQLQKSGGRPGTSLIKDQLTYTGAVAMQAFFGLKNGSSSPETLNIDYFGSEMTSRQFTG